MYYLLCVYHGKLYKLCSGHWTNLSLFSLTTSDRLHISSSNTIASSLLSSKLSMTPCYIIFFWFCWILILHCLDKLLIFFHPSEICALCQLKKTEKSSSHHLMFNTYIMRCWFKWCLLLKEEALSGNFVLDYDFYFPPCIPFMLQFLCGSPLRESQHLAEWWVPHVLSIMRCNEMLYLLEVLIYCMISFLLSVNGYFLLLTKVILVVSSGNQHIPFVKAGCK